jgi:hypothetical protein
VNKYEQIAFESAGIAHNKCFSDRYGAFSNVDKEDGRVFVIFDNNPIRGYRDLRASFVSRLPEVHCTLLATGSYSAPRLADEKGLDDYTATWVLRTDDGAIGKVHSLILDVFAAEVMKRARSN